MGQGVQREDSVYELHSNGDAGYTEDRSSQSLPVQLAEPTPSTDTTPGHHTIPTAAHTLDEAFSEERPGSQVVDPKGFTV